MENREEKKGYVKPNVKGYRNLTEEDVALMNELKELGETIETALYKVMAHVEKCRATEGLSEINKVIEYERLDRATPERFLALAKTNMQTGLMQAIRAVAQPDSF